MNFQKIQTLITSLSKLGLECVVLDKDPETETTRIRSTDVDVKGGGGKGSLIVFHTMDEDITDGKSIAFDSLRAINARISLFDAEKASIEYETSKIDEEQVSKVTFKQGRRKVKTRCSVSGNAGKGPLHGRVPIKFPELEKTGESIVIGKDTANTILKGIQATLLTGEKEKQYVSVEHDENGIRIGAADGKSDAFSEVLDLQGVSDFDKVHIKPYAFQTLIKQSLTESEESLGKEKADEAVATFDVLDEIAVFELEHFKIFVQPLVS